MILQDFKLNLERIDLNGLNILYLAIKPLSQLYTKHFFEKEPSVATHFRPQICMYIDKYGTYVLIRPICVIL